MNTILSLLQKKLALLLDVLYILRMETQTENGRKLLDFCLANRGKSFGNKYVDVGCAEEVNAIANVALGFQIGGSSSTYLMYSALQDTKRFLKVQERQLLGGEIVISPTGYGSGALKNGHTGVYVGDNSIMSNDSSTGLLEVNYKTWSWRDRYVVKGRFPMEFYRILD